MSKLVCDIVTPEAKLLSQDAYMVIVPAAKGEMGFLINHEPLISVLNVGTARIHTDQGGEVLSYAVQGGYVEVTGTKVVILADRALAVSDIDVAQVKALLADLDKQFAEISEDEAGKTTLATDIAWCKEQIRAVEAK